MLVTPKPFMLFNLHHCLAVILHISTLRMKLVYNSHSILYHHLSAFSIGDGTRVIITFSP